MSDPVEMKGWPAGMNNILPDFALPQGTLRDAVNVDILPGGALRRRKGSTLFCAGTDVHSFWCAGELSFFVESGDLKQMNQDGTATTMHAGVGAGRMQYQLLNGDVYYTNGAVTGKIVNGVRREWGVEVPDAAPVLSATTGFMPLGTYQVVCTFVNDLGEESGCGRSTAITLSGGITIALPQPASDEVTAVIVYMTAPDGEVLYEAGSVAAGQASITFNSLPPTGRVCRTQFMVRTFPGEMLAYYRGRFYLSIGNVLWCTQPFAFGLIKPAEDFIQFGGAIDMVMAVDDGLFVACDNTYWLAGSGPQDFTQKIVFPFGAARYSGSIPHNSNDVVWYTARGLAIGSDGGAVALVQSANVLPEAHTQGSTLVKEWDSLHQIIGVVSGAPGISGMAAVDYMEAEIVRVKGLEQ